jgi:hypothetical protein
MAMDEIIAAWAKKCDSKTDEDSKMECHRDQIVALSEHKKAKETHVTAYFDKYLKSTLKRMWESNPIPSFSRFTGYTPSAGAEKHEKADEIYEHLLQELNTTNGNGAREKMMTVYQNAFAAQARHAQALCRSHDENLRRKCPEMFDYLSHNDLESFGRLTVSGLNGANFADDADRISLLERYDNNIYSPLDAWFRDIYASKTPLDQVSFIAIPQSMDAYYRSSASSQTSNATVDVIKARLAAERARTWEIATAGSGTLNSQGRFTEPMPYFSLGNTTGVTGPNAGNVPSPLQQQNGVQQPTTQNFDRVGSGQIPYGRGGQQGTF